VTLPAEFLGRSSKQAHKLSDGLSELPSQTGIRRMAQGARRTFRLWRTSAPVLSEHLPSCEYPAARSPEPLCDFALPRLNCRSDSFLITFRGAGSGSQGINNQAALNREAAASWRRFAVEKSAHSPKAGLLAVNPRHRDLLWTARRPQYNAGPVFRALAETRTDRIGNYVNDAIEEGFMVENRLGGIAAFEEGASALANSVDRSGQVPKEVARPGGENPSFVAHNQVQMVGHHTDGEQPNLRIALLSPREPLEDRIAELAVWPKKESRLVTACRDQIVLARFVASQRSSHHR
jgi:hypothetical protein